jgi:hypothetical protein
MELKLNFENKQVVILNPKFQNNMFSHCDTMTIDGKVIYQKNQYNQKHLISNRIVSFINQSIIGER